MRDVVIRSRPIRKQRRGRTLRGLRTAVACLALLVLPLYAIASQQQQPTFGATVARVRVDVIVTDGEGRFVDDLRPDEFVLYEDGMEQQILSTQVVDLTAGTVAEFATRTNRGDAASPERTDLVMRPVLSAAAGDFGAVIFLVDLPGLDRRNKDRFADEWLKLLDGTELLGIPPDVTQTVLLPVGYMQGAVLRRADRRPAREVTYWNRWGDLA